MKCFRHYFFLSSVVYHEHPYNVVSCFGVADEATTLFRATTLTSTLMEQYMKATATPFVHHALKDTILKIMESKQSCEVMELNRMMLFSGQKCHTVNIRFHCASDL